MSPSLLLFLPFILLAFLRLSISFDHHYTAVLPYYLASRDHPLPYNHPVLSDVDILDHPPTGYSTHARPLPA